MPSNAQNVGIKALEIYFPSRVCMIQCSFCNWSHRETNIIPSIQYVPQSELETYLGASTGKFTIGLGQQKMSFCDDREGMQTNSKGRILYYMLHTNMMYPCL